MRPVGTVLLLLLVAGCGQDPASSGPAPDAGSSGSGGCAGRGTVVARADLDADGRAGPVRLTGAGARDCAHRLVAEGGSVDVAGLDLRGRATVVHLRGADAGDLVLLSSAPHPRGGAQPHLFAPGGPDGLTEVTLDGRPVLPFVATDGGAPPMTAVCTPDGGIGVVTATAHEPPGVILAWDVVETRYGLREGHAVPAGRSTVARAAADPVLRKDRPELFGGRLFAGCS
jgi:hypothetical protein